MPQSTNDVPTVLDDEMYSPKEVAQMVKLKEPTLANMRSKGVGPEYVKLGPYRTAPVRYPRKALLAWVASRNSPEIA